LENSGLNSAKSSKKEELFNTARREFEFAIVRKRQSWSCTQLALISITKNSLFTFARLFFVLHALFIPEFENTKREIKNGTLH